MSTIATEPTRARSEPDGYATDDARFAALAARDRAADGRFVYAVATTGVYCRPSCAARPALRENVAFVPPEAFAAWCARLAAFVERPAGAAGVPLDLYGTAFQRRMWRELQNAPSGTTTTYAALAAAIGKPAAVRAAANACASNPAAVAVPCHRVVRRDGGLGGCRSGLARKRAPLTRESDA